MVDVDQRNTLCLTCSSSLYSKNQAVHTTKCCNQVICASCAQRNPRLTTYHPCLACFGGIGASRGRSQLHTLPKTSNQDLHSSLISDDETVFVLGDDSGEESEEQESLVQEGAEEPLRPLPSELPTYHEATITRVTETHQPSTRMGFVADATPSVFPSDSGTLPTSVHRKYYINPYDTVHGIALRFGVDARELCQQNNLPPSTLSTTPHLLHTRAHLELPLSSKPVPLQYVLSEDDQAKREAQRVKERAEKRLQMVTKEVDWHVAKTYIALADTSGVGDESTDKGKEYSHKTVPLVRTAAGPSTGDLELRAVNMYLDDEDWEQSEIDAGRSPHLPRFPLSPQSTKSSTEIRSTWWPWKS